MRIPFYGFTFLTCLFFSQGLIAQGVDDVYFKFIEATVFKDTVLSEYQGKILSWRIKSGKYTKQDSLTIVVRLRNKELNVHMKTINSYFSSVLQLERNERFLEHVSPTSIELLAKKIPKREFILDATNLHSRIAMVPENEKGRLPIHFFSSPIKLDTVSSRFMVYQSYRAGIRSGTAELVVYKEVNGNLETVHHVFDNHW